MRDSRPERLVFGPEQGVVIQRQRFGQHGGVAERTRGFDLGFDRFEITSGVRLFGREPHAQPEP